MLDVILFFMLRSTGACQEGTVRVRDVCVDMYEAPNEPGVDPVVMSTAYEAERWCESRGKRLCEMEEWVQACEGTYSVPPKLVLNSGVVEAPGTCNNDKAWILPNEAALTRFGKGTAMREAERLWQGEPSGSRTSCVSASGVHDTIGNVEEWVRSPRDKYGYALMGHYWSRASLKCSDRVVNHSPNFYFYTTGFRCCSDPQVEPEEVLTGVVGETVASIMVEAAATMKSTP